MLKISTQGRYAMETVLYLAIRSSERPFEYIPLKEIAGFRGISELYLEHICRRLKQAQILESARGLKGGYRLARPPEMITAADVLHATEGPLTPVPCLQGNTGRKSCRRADRCMTRGFWQDLWQGLTETASSVTMELLVRAGNAKKNAASGGEGI